MTARPGPRNLLTDVPGLRVGQAENAAVRTGVTVVLPDQPAVCAVDVRGGGPGTRETDLLAPGTLVEAVDAIALSGGSVYGLAAADGVVAWLGARGRGFSFRSTDVTAPIVPGAILFDLNNGGDKGWGETPPYAALGRAAVEAAGEDFALGTAGAGYGAMAGALHGGLGSASLVTDDGLSVGALAAVNSFGAVTAPSGRAFWAGAHEIGREFGGLGPPAAVVPAATAPTPPWRWSPSMPASRRLSAATWRSWPRTGWPARSAPCTPPSTATSSSPYPPADSPCPIPRPGACSASARSPPTPWPAP
jgi:L-aminopeptidase/D-esterase-like protein